VLHVAVAEARVGHPGAAVGTGVVEAARGLDEHVQAHEQTEGVRPAVVVDDGVDPGSPWQNAWIESFNGRLRDELLNGWRFDSLLEARVIIEDWRVDYKRAPAHTAHGDLTPTEFARAWTIHHQPEAA